MRTKSFRNHTTVRLNLERLEDRLVPATNAWIGPVGGLWSVPGNWSLAHTPIASDTVTFNSVNASSVVDGTYTVTSVNITAANITLTGSGGSIVTAGHTAVIVNAAGYSVSLYNLTIHTGPGYSSIAVGVNQGKALVQGCDLSALGLPNPPVPGISYPYYGIYTVNGGVVDAGQVGGSNFTGLGVSSGGNTLSGYQNYTGTQSPAGLSHPIAQAILDGNTNAPNNASGPRGQPYDLYAQDNDFGFGQGSTNYPGIEPFVYHDNDFSGAGFVNYTTPASATPNMAGTLFYNLKASELAVDANQRSMIRRVALCFDQYVVASVGGLTVAAFADNGDGTFSQTATVSLLATAVSFDPASGQFRYEYGFPTGQANVEASGSLTDGLYQLQIDATKYQSVAGAQAGVANPTVNFHRLFGDANGLGYIDANAQSQFFASLGHLVGAGANADFDWNNDGSIDTTTDLPNFSARLAVYYSLDTRIGMGWDS